MISITALQMNAGHDVQKNLAQAETLLKQAAKQKSMLAVLPEMFALMGNNEQDKLAIQEPFGHGPIQDFLRQQAKKWGMWIIGGTFPIATNNPQKARAACLVYNPEGECIARYDKMHLFDVTVGNTREIYQESSHVEAGDQIVVFQTPFAKIGLAVCYDLRFPELFRSLTQQGAEIIAVPSAFTYSTGQAHWEVLLRARSVENLCYMIAANQTGLHAQPQRRTFGHSMIVEPWGNILTKLDEEIGIVSAFFDREKLEKIRQDFPVLSHQKLLLSKSNNL